MRLSGRVTIAATALFAAAVCAWWFASGRVISGADDATRGAAHILLIGASIGQDWKLAGWPSRIGGTGYTAESMAVWEFDKTAAVNETLMRPRRPFRFTRNWLKGFFSAPPKVPDVVILKECSSYFPRDQAPAEAAFAGWAKQLRARGIKVILATAVPVTAARSARDAGKQQSLRQFNAWVRWYAAEQGYVLLDLEAALRGAEPEGYLRDAYTSGDGSHLNAAAYQVLDKELVSTLDRSTRLDSGQ
jgi:hypothetical protein